AAGRGLLRAERRARLPLSGPRPAPLARPSRPSTLRAMLSHNSYFDGGVQSIGFERNGRRMTAGVIARGQFHFDTRAPERMTVTSGELLVCIAGQDGFTRYPQGTAFEVPANTGFDVEADGPSSYLC